MIIASQVRSAVSRYEKGYALDLVVFKRNSRFINKGFGGRFVVQLVKGQSEHLARLVLQIYTAQER